MMSKKSPIAACVTASQDIYRTIVLEIADGIIGIDASGIIRICNPAAGRMFGWENDELLDKPLEALLPEKLHAFHRTLVAGFFTGEQESRFMGHRSANIVGRRRDGKEIHLGITIMKTSSTDEALVIAVIRDISESVGYQQDLKRLAETDPLTGLMNRRAFRDSFTTRLSRDEPAMSSLALLDLDEFKALNDRYGHDAGDEVITRFADILRHFIRSGDLAGRWGGEEFILFLPDTSAHAAAAVVERVRAAYSSALFDWRRAPNGGLTFSAGIVTGRIGQGGLDAAVARADIALYDAKRAGRNRVVSIRNPQDAGAISVAH